MDVRHTSGDRPTSAGRPTLRTIAQLTGLSLSTVSLSLRGGSKLKEETRRKVLAVAEQVGYVPNRAGVRLRTGKTNVIALVLDGSDEAIDFARHLIRGVGAALAATRYHLNVMPEFGRGDALDTVRYVLENRTADGMIITHTSPDDPRVRLMMDADFPFVSHGRTAFATPHAFHDFDAEAFTRMAVERLAAKGCRDVLLLTGDDATTNFSTIRQSFDTAIVACGMSGRVISNKEVRPASAEMRQRGAELGRSADRPDGIICDSEIRAIATICGLGDAGLVVGRDIELICKQTSAILPTVFPGIDTIEEDVFAAGVELTRLLLRRIDGAAPDGLQTLADPVAHWRSGVGTGMA